MDFAMHRINYFLDTEFISEESYTSLISIGVVCEDGRELYFQNSNCDFTKAGQWVIDNVFPHLVYFDNKKTNFPIISQKDKDRYCNIWKKEKEIAEILEEFTSGNEAQFWAYYGAWDWVLVNNLFRGMLTIPLNWNQCCYDLRQWLDFHGHKDVVQSESSPHHALLDALWIYETYDKYIK